MPLPDSRAVSHALDVLRGMIGDEVGKPLTPCEKLACRVLLPIAGKRELLAFCRWAEKGNPLYRRAQMEHALRVIENAALARQAPQAPAEHQER